MLICGRDATQPQNLQQQKWHANVQQHCIDIIQSQHGQPKEYKQRRNYPLIIGTANIDISSILGVEAICVQMGVSEIGCRVLRTYDGVKSYIEEMKNLQENPIIRDTLEFQKIEQAKISYKALQLGDGKKAIYYAEKFGDRIGQLSNDLNIEFDSLLSVCQIFGYHIVVFKLMEEDKYVRDSIYSHLEDEKERFERFLDRRLLDLWAQFRKPEIDYETKTISFK